jgi:hypothetical protein
LERKKQYVQSRLHTAPVGLASRWNAAGAEGAFTAERYRIGPETGPTGVMLLEPIGGRREPGRTFPALAWTAPGRD